MQTFKEWMAKKESFEPEHIFAGLNIGDKPAVYSHPERGGLVRTGVKVVDDNLIISKPKIRGKVGDMAKTVASYFGAETENPKEMAEKFYKKLRVMGFQVEQPKETDFGFILKFNNNLDAQRAFHKTKEF